MLKHDNDLKAAVLTKCIFSLKNYFLNYVQPASLLCHSGFSGTSTGKSLVKTFQKRKKATATVISTETNQRNTMNQCINWLDFLELSCDSELSSNVVLHREMRSTFAGCRWDSNTYKVLEGEHAGQKAAVLGPDLSDGFPPAFIHDRYQSKGVKHGVEVHPLANDVDAQKQACLQDRGDTDTAGEGVVWTFSSQTFFSFLQNNVPLGRTCKRSN